MDDVHLLAEKINRTLNQHDLELLLTMLLFEPKRISELTNILSTLYTSRFSSAARKFFGGQRV